MSGKSENMAAAEARIQLAEALQRKGVENVQIGVHSGVIPIEIPGCAEPLLAHVACDEESGWAPMLRARFDPDDEDALQPPGLGPEEIEKALDSAPDLGRRIFRFWEQDYLIEILSVQTALLPEGEASGSGPEAAGRRFDDAAGAFRRLAAEALRLDAAKKAEAGGKPPEPPPSP